MTRDQQIGRALKLLALPPRQRAEGRTDIRMALDRAERGAAAARSFRMAGSKKGTAGVRRYYAALRRTRSAYYALDPAIRPWFSLTETAYIAGKPSLIEREIAIAETFLNRPSLPPGRDASRNKAAVAAAHDLLSWWGHRDVVTRGGKWNQLSKILAGDLTVDLFDHLREFNRQLGPSIEKIRGSDWIVYRRPRRQPGIK